MNANNERKALVYRRRLRGICEQHSIRLDRRSEYKLSRACAAVRGDGLTDFDLRVVARVTARGFLDRFTLDSNTE